MAEFHLAKSTRAPLSHQGVNERAVDRANGRTSMAIIKRGTDNFWGAATAAAAAASAAAAAAMPEHLRGMFSPAGDDGGAGRITS